MNSKSSGKKRKTRKITARQREVLDLIKRSIASNGRPPSLGEIGMRLGVSKACAEHHVKTLQKKGFIEREKGVPRSIKILSPENTGE